VVVDQLAQRDALDWPPARAAGRSFTSHPEECAISLFHTNRDATTSEVGIDSADMLNLVVQNPAFVRVPVSFASGEVNA